MELTTRFQQVLDLEMRSSSMYLKSAELVSNVEFGLRLFLTIAIGDELRTTH